MTSEETALAILDAGLVMAISTVRPDGWPQTTLVGYANDGLELYFMIYRDSQKFANIAQDDRISIAVSNQAREISEAKAVFAGCRASEVTDPIERERGWRLLRHRHPNLAGAGPPDSAAAAMMRARCEHLSVLDYTLGIGHTDALHFDEEPPGSSKEE
jgi:nitroimidazol reductase NimA-like FMN-containing flavoprotein (pyridoxamine 5'-phosphate oxidase superfamily)